MKSSAMLTAFLMLALIYSPAQAKCPPVSVRARGTISGEVQDGDVLSFRFIYSGTRVESSSPQQLQGQTFTITGAYSTLKRHGMFAADICGGVPRQIQIVLRDKSGATLDTVDLTAPDPNNGVVEVNYGKTQTIVLHRSSVASR